MDNLDWPLGPALRQHREAAGLSQAQVATQAGVSASKIRHLEAGYMATKSGRVPTGSTAPTVARVARAVGMDIAEALELAGFAPSAHQRLIDAPDEETVVDIVPGFSGLTERQRDAVVALVESMREPESVPTSVMPRGTAPQDITSRGTIRHRGGNGLRRTGETDTGS